jgi:hypothetical protein
MQNFLKADLYPDEEIIHECSNNNYSIIFLEHGGDDTKRQEQFLEHYDLPKLVQIFPQ